MLVSKAGLIQLPCEILSSIKVCLFLSHMTHPHTFLFPVRFYHPTQLYSSQLCCCHLAASKKLFCHWKCILIAGGLPFSVDSGRIHWGDCNIHVCDPWIPMLTVHSSQPCVLRLLFSSPPTMTTAWHLDNIKNCPIFGLVNTRNLCTVAASFLPLLLLPTYLLPTLPWKV